MSFTRNILPAVYSGMSKVGGFSPQTPLGASPPAPPAHTPLGASPHTPHVGGGDQEGGRRAGGEPPISIPPRGGAGDSIPHRDKKLLHLQEQADQKKKQIKEDYNRLKASVKENPYLQSALAHYDEYFALQQKQINALKTLLRDNALKKEDLKEIKREIENLEKNLA